MSLRPDLLPAMGRCLPRIELLFSGVHQPSLVPTNVFIAPLTDPPHEDGTRNPAEERQRDQNACEPGWPIEALQTKVTDLNSPVEQSAVQHTYIQTPHDSAQTTARHHRQRISVERESCFESIRLTIGRDCSRLGVSAPRSPNRWEKATERACVRVSEQPTSSLEKHLPKPTVRSSVFL